MQTVRLESLAPRGWPSPAVTIGNFDGVHRGHQALVSATVERARRDAGTAVVLTLDPHPARLLDPEHAPTALNTLDQKAEVLAGLGVDRIVVLPFTRELAGRSPEEFAHEILAGALGARCVVVGPDFRFGRGRQGDTSTLRALGQRLGFDVMTIEPVVLGDAAVSSSRVRDALARGDVEEAEALLGRAFFVDGEVVRGAGRGRTLGIPTANVRSENETLPAKGVYAGRCRLPSGEEHVAVINRGHRPTFGGGEETLEAHLLDFGDDLYGARVRVTFAARLRGESRFPGPEALVAQVRADVARARALLGDPRGSGV